MPTPTTQLPRRIDIASTRAIWLADQLRFGDEPLTKTVERCLEAQFAAAQRAAQAEPTPPGQASGGAA